MYTEKLRITDQLSLALQKANFEVRMYRGVLTFLIEKHLDDPDDSFLSSDEYQKALEDYTLKFLQLSQVSAGVSAILLDGYDIDIDYEYSDNFRYIEFTSEKPINVLPEFVLGEDTQKRKFVSFTDFIAKIYPSEDKTTEWHSNRDRTLTRTVTFQVTDKCNLCCTYCYQINKSTRRMNLDDAKLFVDKLLSGADGFYDYVNSDNSPAIIIEFIGGEPFLEVDLIDQIVTYFREQTIKLNHPWATRFCISICSNGVLYTDQKVQQFLQRNKDWISFSVTLDGNKELHDSCRVFPDGSGSYDLAEYATQDWMQRGYYMGSKITISPDNMPYIYDALMHIVGLGYDEINANCIFEQEWTEEQAHEFYQLLKRFADFMLSDTKYKELYCSLYMSSIGSPKQEDDLQNWCGGTGVMLSMDPDGWLFPCIRYMESSLGDSRQPMRIGNVHTGIAQCTEHKQCIDCLNAITRRTQETDQCFYCPIGEGCAWCSAWNYQKYGTADHRDTGICNVHKARVLANVYYWNLYYQKYGFEQSFDLWVPKQWALPIIGEDEYNMLVNLVKENGGYINESDTEIRGYEAGVYR